MFTIFFIILTIIFIVLVIGIVGLCKDTTNTPAFATTIISCFVGVIFLILGGCAGMFGFSVKHQEFTTKFTKALSVDGNHVIIIYDGKPYDMTAHAVVRHFDSITNLLVSWQETPFFKHDGEVLSVVTPDDYEKAEK